MIEVNNLSSITLHIDIPLFWTQVFINEVHEKLLCEDIFEDVSEVDTIDSANYDDVELMLGHKFTTFKDMVIDIKGIDTIGFTRFEITLLKGRLFDWEEIINDLMYLILCFYDTNDGKAELVEFELKKDAKKEMPKSERNLFKKKFSKKYQLEVLEKKS